MRRRRNRQQQVGGRRFRFRAADEAPRLPETPRVYRDVEADLLSAGFHPVLTRSIVGKRDLRNPNEDVVKYIELLLRSGRCSASYDDIRTAIADIFGHPQLCRYNKTLAVFSKNSI